jgi:hypothetical protein
MCESYLHSIMSWKFIFIKISLIFRQNNATSDTSGLRAKFK